MCVHRVSLMKTATTKPTVSTRECVYGGMGVWEYECMSVWENRRIGVCISVGEVRQNDCLYRMMAGEEDVATEVIFNRKYFRCF